jgi:hypothetical protein
MKTLNICLLGANLPRRRAATAPPRRSGQKAFRIRAKDNKYSRKYAIKKRKNPLGHQLPCGNHSACPFCLSIPTARDCVRFTAHALRSIFHPPLSGISPDTSACGPHASEALTTLAGRASPFPAPRTGSDRPGPRKLRACGPAPVRCANGSCGESSPGGCPPKRSLRAKGCLRCGRG